jgi:glucose-1-phosphate adenylyltransferase
MDYGRLLAYHVAEQADITVACIEVPRAEAGAFGVMSVDESRRVVAFAEKPQEPPKPDTRQAGACPGQHGRLCLQRRPSCSSS